MTSPTKVQLEARVAELESQEITLKEVLGVVDTVDADGNAVNGNLIETATIKSEELEALKEQAQVSQDELDNEELQDVLSRPTASLPAKVAAWLSVARGYRISMQDILVTDVDQYRVSYRLRNIPAASRDAGQTFGILFKQGSQTELAPPPEHSHNYQHPYKDGLQQRDRVPVCVCGKSDPESTLVPDTPEVVEPKMDMGEEAAEAIPTAD